MAPGWGRKRICTRCDGIDYERETCRVAVRYGARFYSRELEEGSGCVDPWEEEVPDG